MARYDNPHSRFVAAAKLILPLTSVAVLATLFLFTRGKEFESSIPYARVDIETLAREQRIDGPAFSTVTKDGVEISLSASKIAPDLSNREVVTSKTIVGLISFPDETNVAMTSQTAVIDGPSRIAELAGGVELISSNGYHVSTERIAAFLDASKIESAGEVTATGPFGDFSAGRVELSRALDDEAYQLVFKDGVKLIYLPQTRGDAND